MGARLSLAYLSFLKLSSFYFQYASEQYRLLSYYGGDEYAMTYTNVRAAVKFACSQANTIFTTVKEVQVVVFTVKGKKLMHA